MLEDMIAWARDREIDLEQIRKRKPDEIPVVSGSGKRPKGLDSRSKDCQSHNRCGKCGRTHEGACRSGSGGDSGCFRCGRTRHFSRDCTATATQGSDLICFLCSQRGHKKV